jgi:DnaJ-class molecular chaperone
MKQPICSACQGSGKNYWSPEVCQICEGLGVMPIEESSEAMPIEEMADSIFSLLGPPPRI